MLKIIYQTEVKCPISQEVVENIVQQAAKKEKKITGIVEITVVGDSAIRKLNKNHRGKDAVTDVLSFAWGEDNVVPSQGIGEIYISYPQIVRQARQFKVATQEEFGRMLTHGLLHLVGYDHVKSGDAKKMFSLQEKIVAVL